MATEAARLEQRRELAARVDCLVREDFCALAGITGNTEEAWRKRGKAPPYVVLGNEILYPTRGLSEHLVRHLRGGAQRAAGSTL